MNFREMHSHIFQRKPVPHVFFQPRFEPWYDWHRTFHSLSESMRGMTLLEVYDQLQVSMRTVHYYFIRLKMVSDWCRGRTFPLEEAV